MQGLFDNTRKLVRFILRRERVVSTIWILCLVTFSVALAAGMANMFDDTARQALALTLENPGIIAMMGPVYGADNYTVGAMYSNCLLLWVALSVGVMNVFLVVRHTRGDEERNRSELVRSLPTGRLATLNATMIVAVIINTALALLIGFGIAALGIESMDLSAALLYGVALGACGLVFAAITAIFCQLSSSSQTAIGASLAVLGICYMLRAVGDIGQEALSYISPLGLMQRSQVFVQNDWWPMVALLLEVVVIAAIAYALNSIRDIDQGFVPAKPGRTGASAMLRSPFGLSFRLLRNSLIIWFIVMFLLGASYGSILGDIETFVANSEFYQQIIGVNNDYSVPMMFTSMVNSIAALICVVPLLIAALKARSEEKENRTEQVLAGAVSRVKYLGGFVLLAFVASALFQCATACGLYIAAAAVLEEPIALGFLLEANLVYVPALWVMIGVAVLLTGIFPRLTSAVWAYFAYSFAITFLGRVLDFPDWLSKTSPFGFIPQLPVDSVDYVALVGLALVAVVLTGAGFVFYKKRDLAT